MVHQEKQGLLSYNQSLEAEKEGRENEESLILLSFRNQEQERLSSKFSNFRRSIDSLASSSRSFPPPAPSSPAAASFSSSSCVHSNGRQMKIEDEEDVEEDFEL